MKQIILTKNMLVGAIEAGGTKFVCAVGSGPGEGVRARVEFPTTDDPLHMMAQVRAWFEEQQKAQGKLDAIGIASFGPIDVNEASATYGFITSTPKPGWRDTNIVGAFRSAFPGIPIGFDTDVNGAALGEFSWGQAQGLDDFVYITIGTGIGAGGLSGGRLLHGLVHPEMGHMRLARQPGDDFAGVCLYHGACWEGLCSGPAMLVRTGLAAEQLPMDHPAWRLETEYIAQAISNIVCVLSPQRIIVGGSVRKGGRLGEALFFDWFVKAYKCRSMGTSCPQHLMRASTSTLWRHSWATMRVYVVRSRLVYGLRDSIDGGPSCDVCSSTNAQLHHAKPTA